MDYLLSLIIFFPAVAGVLGFIVSKDSIRVYGISVAAIEFMLSLWLWISFDGGNAGFQFVEFMPLIPMYGISFYIGVDANQVTRFRCHF